MRLATFNILNGRSTKDGTVRLDRLADAVRTLDADVLGLQEVDRLQQRSHLADLTAVAADAMGAQSQQFAAALSGTPGATWVAATGREIAGERLVRDRPVGPLPRDQLAGAATTENPDEVPDVVTRTTQGDRRARRTADRGDRYLPDPARSAGGGQHPPVLRPRVGAVATGPGRAGTWRCSAIRLC